MRTDCCYTGTQFTTNTSLPHSPVDFLNLLSNSLLPYIFLSCSMTKLRYHSVTFWICHMITNMQAQGISVPKHLNDFNSYNSDPQISPRAWNGKTWVWFSWKPECSDMEKAWQGTSCSLWAVWCTPAPPSGEAGTVHCNSSSGSTTDISISNWQLQEIYSVKVATECFLTGNPPSSKKLTH